MTRLAIPATPVGVREVLRSLDREILADLPEAERNVAQIVLAEVLNNIVEHAYAEQEGEIGMEVRQGGEGVCFVVTDRGAGMPGGRLPEGSRPQPMELQQGGYGWFLIRSLTRDLRYLRENGCNVLSFRLSAA